MSVTVTKPIFIKEIVPTFADSKTSVNLKGQFQRQKIIRSPQMKRKLDYEHSSISSNMGGQFKIRINSPKNMLIQEDQQNQKNNSKTQTNDQISAAQQRSTRTIRKNPSIHTISKDETIKKETQNRGNKEPQGHTQFYKYWKLKANQYQQNNFNLLKLNSNLQQQIEKLRSENQNIKIKLENKCKQIETKLNDVNLSRLQQHKSPVKTRSQISILQLKNKQLQLQLQKLVEIIKRQQQKIEKQNFKIEELSKVQGQNSTLKNLLNNLQNKFSQIRSNDDKKEKSNVFNEFEENKLEVQNKKLSRVLNKKISHEIEKKVIDDFIRNQKSSRRYTGDNLL